MDISKQVCSLEQAKKLKELGVIQHESQFYFRDNQVWHFNEVTDWTHQEQLHNLIQSGDEADSIVATFTVAELGVMLPDEYSTDRYSKDKEVTEQWKCKLQYQNTVDDTYGSTEAKARAAMLIYLLESNLTNSEEVSKRLNK